MQAEGYRAFIRDLNLLLIERACDPEIFDNNGEFNSGYRMALYYVIHLIEGQAESWDIDRSEIGLEGFSADDWLRLGKEYVASRPR